jgi:hypothetical protein
MLLSTIYSFSSEVNLELLSAFLQLPVPDKQASNHLCQNIPFIVEFHLNAPKTLSVTAGTFPLAIFGPSIGETNYHDVHS